MSIEIDSYFLGMINNSISGSWSGTFTYIKPGVPAVKMADGATILGDVPGAVEGDKVTYDGSNINVIPNVLHLVGVLQLTAAKRYGVSKGGLPIYNFVPLSWRYPNFMVASSAKKKYNGDIYVTIEYNGQWDKKYPSGHCTQVIGSVTDKEAQELALLHKNNIYIKSHPKFQASQCPIPPIPDQSPNPSPSPSPSPRPVVLTIDPKGSKDLDDAFHVDGEHIHVHIADVDYHFPADGVH
jgi:exoribonuclease R